jgi:crossover junction endodeoxyribonuclease RusA
MEFEPGRDHLLLFVAGRPAPQGSKSYKGNQRFVEASKYLPAWRSAIIGEVKQAFNATQDVRRFTDPVKLKVTFFMDRPKNPKWPFPATTPDIDKLVRGVCDALTLGGAWADDCLVVQLEAAEVWCGVDTSPVSGANIEIWRL